MAKRKIESILEGMTLTEIVEWYKERNEYRIDRAYKLGQVDILRNEMHLTAIQIAEKLGINESSARRLIYDLNHKK